MTIGFSFKEDVKHLLALVPGITFDNLLDLQVHALRLMQNHLRRGDYPSLQTVCEFYTGKYK